MTKTKSNSCILALGLCLAPLFLRAQDNDYYELDEVVVKGTRASLLQSRDAKRESNTVRDSIVAEDIAKFPDLNLAESLQRLPGVAINREAGEGRRVSLRGLGPDFTRVQLNGMEVLGNVDSPQDSRGQGTRDRAFDFNIFASELFSRMDVYKSYQASLDEGGMAGTVGLYTAKPFDKEGFNATVSTQAGTNTATGDFQPRIAALVSNTWDTFGALVSVAYSSRDTEEQGYNTYRWRPLNASGSDISDLSPEDQVAVNSGELLFARGNRYSVWKSQQERLGITSALQWIPSDSLDLTLDLMHGEFKGDRDELHLAARGAGSTWLGGGTTVNGVTFPGSKINELQYNDNNEVVYLDVSGANIATETRRQVTKNTFDQIALSGNWAINDKLVLSGTLGAEISEYKMPISDKFYLENFGDVISDYTQDRFYGHNTYGFDPTDASVWRAHEIDFSASEQKSTIGSADIDLEYTLKPGSTITLGVSTKTFKNSGFTRANDNVLRSEWQSGEVDDDPSSYLISFSEHDQQSWAIVDFDKALATYGIVRDAGEKANIFEIEETTDAAYLQYDWNTKIGEMTFRGNAGLRQYQTKITSAGEANIGWVSVTEKYSDLLPALNMALDMRQNLVLRAAVSQNINRPSLSALAVNGSISENNGEITVSTGNPDLDPYQSDNYDISLEWYFGEIGYAAVGLFYKDISGFIGTDTATNIPYSETGLPLDLLEGLTPETIVAEFSRPINYEQTDITGIEFSFQSDLSFLPKPFDKLGFVGNMTFIDSEMDYASPSQQAEGISLVLPLEGMSDKLGNATLYYETDTWGARISANYRSGYVGSAIPIGNEQDSSGFNSTTYLDVSAFYQINERLKLTFDAINLTDEREEQYSDSSKRLYNTTTSGTSFLAGVNYQF